MINDTKDDSNHFVAGHDMVQWEWLDEIFLNFAKRVETMVRGKTYGWDDEREAVVARFEAELLRELTDLKKQIQPLPKHIGTPWQRGYTSAQIKLVTLIKRRIAELQAKLNTAEGKEI